jgi:PAS domain S-box-containing protein
LPERHRHGFATKYPAAWEQLRREMSGSVAIAGKDYLYMRVYPLRSIAEPDARLPLAQPAAPDGYYWYIIVTPRQLPATVNQARHVGMTYMGGGAVGLLLLVLSFALAYAIARQHALSMALGRAVDNLPVLIAYIDNGQRFRFNNRAYLDVYGIAPRELYGKQLADVVGAEAYAKLQPHLEQALAGEQAECELHIEMGTRQLDLAVTLVPDLTGGGHVRGIYAQATDITQRKASEQREREHLLELAKVSRMASVGEITSEIAHQVNQPLAAIAMFSNAAQRTLEKGGEPGQLRDWMVTINAQAKRASDIIQRMRRFARREDMQSTALDLNETVREVVGLLEPVARARQVEVRLDLADSVPPVLASAALMEQVIYHLLRNAIRSAEGAAPAGLVTVRSRADATLVSVEVCNRAPASDRSPDMPDFDTLQGHQADTACADLSTSREIVGGLQGELYCLCTPEGGSQIYFTLPIMEP